MRTLTIQQLLQDLHVTTGLATHLYDAQQRGLIHYGKTQPICNLVHLNEESHLPCHAFDHLCFGEAKRTGDVFTATCPFGLYAAISPIYDGEKLLGFLQLDCAMLDSEETLANAKRATLAFLPDNPLRIDEKLAQTKKIAAARVATVPSLLRMACGYIEANNLFPVGDITLGILAKRYIKHNLQSKLTLADICTNLHCSKATLTETFRREFGITIVQYINRTRLEKACNLLGNTDLPIHTVAEECGFSGAEYFSSLFKRALGTSPLAYRRQNTVVTEDPTNTNL